MAYHSPYPFAGMRTADAAVFQRFLNDQENTFADSYYYNLRVSSQNSPIPDLPPELQPLHRTLRRKRIDVVAMGYNDPLDWPIADFPILERLNEGVIYTQNFITIIEVKVRANPSALGQLVSYPILFRQTFPLSNSRPIKVCLIAEMLTGDTEFLCKWLGIPYLLYP